MEWLSNLDLSDVLLIIIIMYLHCIRMDISKYDGMQGNFRQGVVTRLDELLRFVTDIASKK
ncbi:MAG: hypothetical protein ACJZ16_04820 [Methylophilaceae bacterium]